MGCALDAVLAQDSVEEQEDVGIYSMLSGQASSAYPAVKTPWSSPRTEGYGSPRDKTPRIQAQVPTDKQEARTLCSPTTGIASILKLSI